MDFFWPVLPPLPLGAAVLSTPVSCMQLSALLIFGGRQWLGMDTHSTRIAGTTRSVLVPCIIEESLARLTTNGGGRGGVAALLMSYPEAGN